MTVGSTVKRKVFAYITHGDRLLVYRHVDVPEAGIQVPAGTVRPGERLEDAVLREGREETGLSQLAVLSFLGEERRDMRDFGQPECHHRFFFHLGHRGHPPEVWQHCEADPAHGGPPIRFELFWAKLPDQIPDLVAGHDAMLPNLVGRMFVPESCG